MQRVFFTDQMAKAILDGKKTATTRDHQWSPGEKEACTGSWRVPASVKPFSVINVIDNRENTWQHTIDNFKMEGFECIEDFRRFLHDTGLQRYAREPHLYFHVFELVRKLG